MTTYDPTKHGIESKRKGSAELMELWTQVPVTDDPKRNGLYWPVEAIWFDNAISPRSNGRTDRDTVERYAEILDQLPPIKVRKRTGQLIDGKHRLEATVTAGLKHIRVVEVDCTDEEMIELAFLANSTHGYGYSNAERTAAAHRIWDAKIARGETPNQTEFAGKFGVSRRVVVNWAQQARGGEKSAQSAQPKAPKATVVEANDPNWTASDATISGGTVVEIADVTPASEPEYAPPPFPADAPMPEAEPEPTGPRLYGQNKFGDIAVAILDMADFEDGKLAAPEFLANLPGGFSAQLGVNEITAASRWLSAAARAMRVRATKGE